MTAKPNALHGLAIVRAPRSRQALGRWVSLALLLGLWSGLLSGCCGLLTEFETGIGKPKVVVEWDPAPETVILQAARPIQHYQPSIAPGYRRNYIPEARVWGDGRIVWTSYAANGARTVLEGRLTQAQLRALLQQFVDAGFFNWKTSYTSWLPYDNPPSDYLMVRLRSEAKTVSVTMTEPPQGYETLFRLLNSGAGVEGKVFQPQQAILMAQETSATPQMDWTQENLNLNLAAAAKGLPVEGRALQRAWDAVNQNPFFPPAVQWQGAVYTLYVKVPGLMYE